MSWNLLNKLVEHSSWHLSMPSQTHRGGNGRRGGEMGRRAILGQGTTYSAWESHTAVTHVISLRAKLFNNACCELPFFLPALQFAAFFTMPLYCLQGVLNQTWKRCIKDRNYPSNPTIFYWKVSSFRSFPWFALWHGLTNSCTVASKKDAEI